MKTRYQPGDKLWIVVLILAVWFVGSPAHAALINAQGQVWALNANGPARNYYPLQRASDGNTGSTWVTEAGFPEYFTAYPNGQPVLLFDLGADVTMNGMGFFNYSTSNANNTRAFSLRFATSQEGPLGMARSISYQPSFNTAFGGPTTQEDLAFSQPVTARYVQMTVTDNYYGVDVPPVYPGGDRVGFAEAQFEVATPPAFQAPVTLTRPTANVTDLGSNVSLIDDGTPATQWYSVAHVPDYFAAGTTPVLVIDVGSQKTMSGLNFWNYSVAGNRTKDFSLRFATEGEGPGGFGSSISYQPSFTAANLDQNQKQSFDFSQAVSARYVEMTITDNYYGAGTGGDRVGFAEIGFRDATPPLGYTAVVRPVSATSSTAATDYYPVANLIDGSAGTTWVTVSEGDYYTNRFAPILTFDLGSDFRLTGAQLQNYPVPGNAAKDIALAFATDADGPNGFGASIDYFPIFQPAVTASLVQDFSFDRVVEARYVQVLVLDNYAGWGYAGGDRVGFAEFALLTVPEPSSLLLAGLSGCLFGCWCLRRRRGNRQS